VLVTEPAFLEKALAVRARGATALELIVLVEGCHTEALDLGRLLAAAPSGFDAAATAAASPRRPGDPHLHLGHDRRAKGRRAHAPQRRGPVRGAERGIRASSRDSRAISWLPMGAHRRAAVHHYLPMQLGWRSPASPTRAPSRALLAEVRPQFFFSPPRLWEKLRAATWRAR
jgi:hypothetical protein